MLDTTSTLSITDEKDDGYIPTLAQVLQLEFTKYEMLGSEQQRAIFAPIWEGQDTRELRNEVVMRTLPYVVSRVIRMHPYMHPYEYEQMSMDIINESVVHIIAGMKHIEQVATYPFYLLSRWAMTAVARNPYYKPFFVRALRGQTISIDAPLDGDTGNTLKEVLPDKVLQVGPGVPLRVARALENAISTLPDRLQTQLLEDYELSIEVKPRVKSEWSRRFYKPREVREVADGAKRNARSRIYTRLRNDVNLALTACKVFV